MTAWALVVVVVVLPVLLRIAVVRHALARLSAAALERLTPEPVVDQDVLDLYRALRRERLLADVERLRRVLLTDETKSAVRQIGNRMAYDRLLHDLAEIGEVAGPGWARTASPAGRASRWSTSEEPWSRPVEASWAAAPAAGHRPVVEVLELGRRR